MPRKRTHAEFVSDMKTANPNVEIIGTYIDNRTHIAVKCVRHGIVWETIPQTLYLGCGCELCRVEKISEASRTRNEDFIKAVESVNPNIEILSQYRGQKFKIQVRCKTHNVVWNPRADSVLDGHGCNECKKEKQSISIAIPETEIATRLEQVAPTVKLIGRYTNTTKRAKFQCSVCGHVWNPVVNAVLSGHGCPKCGYEKMAEKTRLSNDEFVGRLKKINPTIKPLESYVSGKRLISVECTLCGRIWNTRPDRLLEGNGCATCASSKGERAVRCALDELSVGYSQEHIFLDCRHKWPLRYDFYLHDFRTAIEYQGRQHYEAEEGMFRGSEGLAERQLRDQIKRDYCAANNIRLVEIPYWQIKEIPTIIKELISSIGESA